MKRIAILSVLAVAACSTAMQSASESRSSATAVAARADRTVQRAIPMPPVIRRAFTAGTRDSSGRPGRNYWQLRTDYTIHVRLDPATSRLTGRETVLIRNDSPDTLRQIGLRLDMNHFLFNVPRAAPWVPSELTDGMVITRMTVNGETVNLAPAAPQGRGGAAPTPGGPFATGLRSTVARVNLLKHVLPRQTATLEIEWNHKVPGGPGSGHRMTQRWGDTLYQPTQWYPRVAVYDDLRGWDPELYLGPSEFYNNFGRFDVRIDVPAGWVVSGTGILQNPQEVLTQTARDRLARVLDSDAVTTIVGPEETGPGRATADGDRLVWHMVADTVNDFAWATAKQFVWQATRATIPGKGRVPIHMVYLPGRAAAFANAGPITRHALEFYSRLWFPYEFPQLTLQDGPSAGMEYPMVINSNQGAADHEAAHQWWPMVVSNNETWYGWMDEGFNQYMNISSDASARSLGVTAGRGGNAAAPAFAGPAMPSLYDGLGQAYGRSAAQLGDAEAPMMWNANYAGPTSYGFTTYSKTPLMLSMLGGIVGDSAVQRAHREWAVAWKYKHPSPWDYMFFMNRALNRDLGWFWNYWLFETATVEGSIQGVTMNGTRADVTVRQDGEMPSPIVLRVELVPTGPEIPILPNARMIDERTAIVTIPVDVWFGGSRAHVTSLDFGRAIQKITLDPFGRFPDRNAADNVWPR
ncbi:MAG TPA: M1 family metallopeptidase [Gemmatimonadaceae bacterium]|nr:M1 family metallopeptidase [Gemmatimonadaceae bacterium]